MVYGTYGVGHDDIFDETEGGLVAQSAWLGREEGAATYKRALRSLLKL